MIFFSKIQQTEALVILAALGVPKKRRIAVKSIDDFRGFLPAHFLLIENGDALRIPAAIMNEAKRLGHTMVHVKATAAALHSDGGLIEKT